MRSLFLDHLLLIGLSGDFGKTLKTTTLFKYYCGKS